MIDAETGQRGYLLTGNASYLEPYNRSISVFPQRLASVLSIVRNATQGAVLASQVGRTLHAFERSIESRAKNGLDAAIRLIIGDEAKRQMDSVRASLRVIREDAAARLEVARRALTRGFPTATYIILAVGGFALLLCAFLVIAFLHRSRDLALAQRRNELNKQSSDLKRAFLGTVSHEMRTPMHGILVTGEELARSHLEGDQREMLDIMLASSKSLMRLIDDLLLLTKVLLSPFLTLCSCVRLRPASDIFPRFFRLLWLRC